MNFDEAAAEWVYERYPAGRLIVGSVKFERSIRWYPDGYESDIELSYREKYRPTYGRVNGVWRYGDTSERTHTYKLPPDTELTQLIREIVEIALQGSTQSEPSVLPSAAVEGQDSKINELSRERPGAQVWPGQGNIMAQLEIHSIRVCPHVPSCPSADAHDREAAHTISTHPEQGWSLLCNGVILFDDTGELLPGGIIIAPHRSHLSV